MQYYHNLHELLRHSASSCRFFQLQPIEMQMSLHEQGERIHTESDLRNTVNVLAGYRHQSELSGEM